MYAFSVYRELKLFLESYLELNTSVLSAALSSLVVCNWLALTETCRSQAACLNTLVLQVCLYRSCTVLRKFLVLVCLTNIVSVTVDRELV